MEVKNQHGLIHQEERNFQGEYQWHANNLISGYLPFPNEKRCDQIRVPYRSIKSPNKYFRIPPKPKKNLPILSIKKNSKNSSTQIYTSKVEPNKKRGTIACGLKNADLLNHMIYILRNNQERGQSSLRVETQPESYNQFDNVESLTPIRNSRGPVLDPKISRFYQHRPIKRLICSEQKNRPNNNKIYIQQNLSSLKSNDQKLFTFFDKMKSKKQSIQQRRQMPYNSFA